MTLASGRNKYRCRELKRCCGGEMGRLEHVKKKGSKVDAIVAGLDVGGNARQRKGGLSQVPGTDTEQKGRGTKGVTPPLGVPRKKRPGGQRAITVIS